MLRPACFSLPDCCQLDSWDPAGFHWVPPSTFVPPGDETGDEPQLRRSDLSQDKDPLDPQTAEAQGAANEAAGMGWRPTNRAAGMVSRLRAGSSVCHLLTVAGPHLSCHWRRLPSGSHLPGQAGKQGGVYEEEKEPTPRLPHPPSSQQSF